MKKSRATTKEMTEKKGVFSNVRTSQEGYKAKDTGEIILKPHCQFKGVITRDAEVRPATDEKKAFFAGSVAVNGVPVHKIWDAANRIATKGKTYNEGDVFMNIVAYEKTAETIAKLHKDFAGLKKGDIVDLSGSLKKESYTKKDGSAGEQITLVIDRISIDYRKAEKQEQETSQAQEIPECVANAANPVDDYGDEEDEDIPF